MRFSDYLRLGCAGVKVHKKRALTVAAIVGLLFGIIMAGAFMLQGLEDAALGEMLKPTGGKVLVMSAVDMTVCGESCDVELEVGKIREKVGEYGGEVVSASIERTADGVFYGLKGVFESGEDAAGSDDTVLMVDDAAAVLDDAIGVMVPLAVAADLAGIEMPGHSVTVTAKWRAVENVREETLGKVVESRSGEKYYIAGILPGGVYASDLSFRNLGQDANALDLILGQIQTGASQSFVFSAGAEGAETETAGLVFAQFPGMKAAYDYYRDEVNYCAEFDRMFGRCDKSYRYQVRSAISDPLATYEALKNVWLVFTVTAAVLMVIALIIALSTYVRLIAKDMKIIALYHAMGATGRQIRMVYVVHLLMLSMLAVVFAAMVGLVLAGALSLVNMTAFEQLFALGFGAAEGKVWLIGWNGMIWVLVGALMVVAIVAVMLGSFRAGELARKMK